MNNDVELHPIDSAAPAATVSEIRATVDDHRDVLLGLSHAIHATPEVGFEEVVASGLIADALETAGFAVERAAFELPTSLRAKIGSGDLTVAICAEYDALPGIGHACGHNVIAAAAVGAGLALAPIAEDLGITLVILGTPAEESGGGKALMIERGAFDGVDAAMMVHPSPIDALKVPASATSVLDVAFAGRGAHAGAFPHMGLNAADAMTIAQVSLGLLRQQLQDSDRVAGIVLEAGSAVNIIPDSSRGRWSLRAATADRLAELVERVRACFGAGALATGCTATMTRPAPDYADMVHNDWLLERYRINAESLGRTFPMHPLLNVVGPASDMGNVSHVVPSIHPMIGINSLPSLNHEPGFTAACITPDADSAVLDGATAMALTIVDLARERPQLSV